MAPLCNLSGRQNKVSLFNVLMLLFKNIISTYIPNVIHHVRMVVSVQMGFVNVAKCIQELNVKLEWIHPVLFHS